MTQDTSQAKQLHLLRRTITLYAVFGTDADTRNRLLQIATDLTGKHPRTLTAALDEIEIKIEKLRGQIK